MGRGGIMSGVHRRDPLEATAAALETTLLRGAEGNAQEAQGLATELMALEDAMRGEMTHLEELSHQQTEEVRQLEEAILAKVHDIKLERKAAQVAIFDSIDEKTRPIAEDINAYRQQ